MALQFEWDLQKAAANHRKHDLTFEEAATAGVAQASRRCQSPQRRSKIRHGGQALR